MAGAAPPAPRAYLSVVEGHRKLYFNDRELAAQAVSLLFGQGPVKDNSVGGDTMVHCLSMRVLEAAAAHFQRDFKGLRDVILYLRNQARAPKELVKSLERLNSAHGFVQHMTAFSCDCVLAHLHLLPPAPCAPDAEPSCGQEGKAQAIQPTLSGGSQLPADVHFGCTCKASGGLIQWSC